MSDVGGVLDEEGRLCQTGFKRDDLGELQSVPGSRLYFFCEDETRARLDRLPVAVRETSAAAAAVDLAVAVDGAASAGRAEAIDAWRTLMDRLEGRQTD